MGRSPLSILAGLSLVLIRTSGFEVQAAPAIATDRPDYSPGSRAAISGAGFRSGEKVRLQVLHIDLRDNDIPAHQPWLVKADGNGNFTATWPVTVHEAGATLRLSALGMSSGLKTQHIFTDSSITPASGGTAIAADTYNGAFTPLTGPVLVETIVGDVSAGTLVLTTPPGFVFDTNAPLPIITLNGDANNKNINGLRDGDTISLTVTTNSLGFTITSKSKGQTRNTLTYSNVRVRPTVPTPLASGNITNTGTSTFPNSTANFGTLTEVAGGLTQVTVSGFPTPRTAGIPGSVTVTAQDQFGNTKPSYAGTIHFTSSDALAVLPADYTFAAGDNGVHTFTNGVTLKTFGTQSITATNLAAPSSSGSQTGIAVFPAAADRLGFAIQPGSATYGSLLNPQPVLVTKDAFGNNSVVGLAASTIVSLTLSSGAGALGGTTSLNIGTAAGNGTVTFTNLSVNSAGAGKQLTASAAGLTNAVSSTFTINPASVTANVTASNKVYDATTTVSIASRSLTGVLGLDNVTLTGGSAAFVTKTVGNGKTVNVTGLSLSGTSAGNYVLSSTNASTTANITLATLTVTGATANNKVYDGTTNTTLSGGIPSGVMSGDSVTLGGTPSGTFANRAVANNKPVTASGYAISGPDSGNYTLVQPSGLTANITPAAATVSGITANNKPYDGNTSVTLNTGSAALVGVVSGDSVTLNTGGASGLFSTKTVGIARPVTVSGLAISGTDSGNYSLTQPNTSADITPKGLTVSGVIANDKTYDGNTAVTLNTASAALVGVVSGDTVSLDVSSANGAFANPNSGSGKSVTVSGLGISGAGSGNYSLSQPSAIANINRAGLIVLADNKSRAYGAPNPRLSASYAGFVNGESMSVLTGAPQLGTTADTNSPVANYPIQVAVGTLSSANYTYNFTNGTLTVSQATLIVTANDKARTYGAANPGLTGTLTTVLNGDNITASYMTLADAQTSVGSYSIVPSLNDPDSKLGNYSVATNSGTLTINPATLVAVAHNASRGYGQANPAFSVSIWGYVNGDDAAEVGGSLVFDTPAQFNSPPGNYPIIPSGLVATDYSITYSNGALTITSTNLAPVMGAIADAVLRPEQPFTLRLSASDPNGDSFTFSLDPGAPAGAVVTNLAKTYPAPTNYTIFSWRPTRAQASTTNLITVRVTDNGGPPMSSAQTFTIIVQDYVEIAVASTNVQSGQSVVVPIYLASSDGVTNLSFNLQWRPDYLANPALTVTAPGLVSGTMQDQGTNLAFVFQAAPAQVLQGTQQIAQLTFDAITNEHSAFLSLSVGSTSAAKPDGSAYVNYLTPASRITVIEGQPLLWAFLSADSQRELTLYGRLGNSYQLQYSTNNPLPGGWSLWSSYVQTNNAITIGVDSLNPTILYRIFQP